MISFHNILTVARYEARILRRSWLFRLFAIFSLFILSIMNLGIFSPIGDEDWEFLAIPSSIPYLNLYLLNIGQALVIIFLASDFLKKDKKLDTNEVLYTRSMSNFEYIMGKSWGILRLFLGLNILILLEALVINLIARNTWVDISSYLSSLVIISIPTLVFSLGLAYIIMSLVRNQALTFLLLLGYAALNIFYLYYREGGLFDYMLFGMPVFKSQITGYSNPELIASHRLLYFLSGMACIFLTSLLFKRLPQSKTHRALAIVLLTVSTLFTGLCAKYYLNNFNNNRITRENTVSINAKYENTPLLIVDSNDIILEHKGEEIIVGSKLQCRNNHDFEVSSVVFSLNPSLKVTSAAINGQQTAFSREGHIIRIDRPLKPGENIIVNIKYQGNINEAYCYPWLQERAKENEFRIGPLPVDQRQAVLNKNFVLLTSETNWYPVSSLNFFPSNPARIKVDFTNFSLKVKHSQNLTAISQGTEKQEDGYSCFAPHTPLTGLTLVIGDFKTDTLRVDSIMVSASYKSGNDYFKNDLNEIGDTLKYLVSSLFTELETNLDASYPFKELKLVEVPVWFRSVDKKNTQTRSEVQPSMILLPEKLATMEDGDFYRTLKRNRKRMERSNQIVTEKELQVRAINAFMRNSFVSGRNTNFRNGRINTEISRYLLGPSYYFFKNNFYSENYPVINAVFESHLQKVENQGARNRGFLGGLSENDKANNILKDLSFQELLSLDPSYDTMRIVLALKGDYLFNMIREGTGQDKFNKWFSSYLEQNKFRNIKLEEFDRALEKDFGINIGPSMEQWYNGSLQAGFYFTNVNANEIIVDNRTRYHLSFVASNPEASEGIFTVSCRTAGQGRGMMGGGRSFAGGGFPMGAMRGGQTMQPSDPDRIIKLAPGQAKEINIILDAQPRAIMINTLSSVNNPGNIMIPVDEVKVKNNYSWSEDERILDHIPAFCEEGEIIVDNEDPGFTVIEQIASGRLKKWLGISGENRNEYNEIFSWWAPEYWQKTIRNNYYGKYIKSAHYTRGGSGERYVRWSVPSEGPGYYDIYAYVNGRGQRGQGRSPAGLQEGGRNRRRPSLEDLHFTIYHSNEKEELTLDTEKADMGWNHLGSYYIDNDSLKVELSNLTEGRTVEADAIKWIKEQR